MQEPTVIFETNGPVATVTLNRPDVLNAFNDRMRQELLAAVRSVESEDPVRVVVLRGAGRAFCSGADLSEGMSGSVTEQLENEYKPIFLRIAESRKIWIASIHGSAAGIGGALAMNCDLVAMAETAYIYLAFAAIGLVPDGGSTWLLLHAMGYRKALETIVEGRKIPAQECLAAGLANRIEKEEVIHEKAQAWAESLARGAPLAQAAAKRILRRVGQASYGEAFSMEAAEQLALTRSEDFHTGVKAFFGRETPVFKGK